MRCPKCNFNNPRQLKTFEIEGQKYCLCQNCYYFIEIKEQSSQTNSFNETTLKLLFILIVLSYTLEGLRALLIPVLVILLCSTLFYNLPLTFFRITFFLYIAIIPIQRLVDIRINQIE